MKVKVGSEIHFVELMNTYEVEKFYCAEEVTLMIKKGNKEKEVTFKEGKKNCTRRKQPLVNQKMKKKPRDSLRLFFVYQYFFYFLCYNQNYITWLRIHLQKQQVKAGFLV